MSNSIHAFRKLNGYSQSQLAQIVNVPQTTISGWEQGTIDALARKIILLACTLNVSVEELFPPLVKK